ncbi:MAG: transposase [Pseudonocardiaceae bacterium]
MPGNARPSTLSPPPPGAPSSTTPAGRATSTRPGSPPCCATDPHGEHLANWPADLRIICRREKPHPGAQLSLFEEHDGWRYQLPATNAPAKTTQFLEARHRPHAHVEDCIRTGKNTGLGHLPSTSIGISRAWCVAATIACDLLCWLRLLCLDGPLAKAEPKTLRYRLLHTAARIVHGQRKRKIRIPATWPWAQQLATCLLTELALPPPTPC